MKLINIFLKFLTIRRAILLSGLIYISFFLLPNWFVSNSITKITGTYAKADVSLIELLRGNIYFKKLTVYSSGDYNGAPALSINDLKININILSLFSSDKIINELSSSEIKINSVFANNSNNIEEIIMNMRSYFNKTSKVSGDNTSCKINDVFLRNIHLNTYYYSDKPIRTILPAIHLSKVGNNGDITKTVSELLVACFSVNIDKEYEGNVSWWNKTAHAVSAGINFSVNALGTGLNITKNALNTAEDIQSTIGDVNENIDDWNNI